MSVPAGDPPGSGQTPREGLRGVPGEPESRGVTSQTWLGLGAQGLLRWVGGQGMVGGEARAR